MTFRADSISLFGRFITEDVEKMSPDKTNRQQTDVSEHSRGGAKAQMYRILNAFTTDLAMWQVRFGPQTRAHHPAGLACRSEDCLLAHPLTRNLSPPRTNTNANNRLRP